MLLDHADHLLPVRRLVGPAVNANAASDGVSPWPQSSCRQIVDDGDLACRIHFFFAEQAALEEPDAHRLEVAVADLIDFGDLLAFQAGPRQPPWPSPIRRYCRR